MDKGLGHLEWAKHEDRHRVLKEPQVERVTSRALGTQRSHSWEVRPEAPESGV